MSQADPHFGGPDTVKCIPSDVAFVPTSATSNQSAQGTVTLNKSVPSTPLSVSLSSNNSAVTVPQSITIAVGQSSGTFTAHVGTVTASASVGITASTDGGSKTGTLSISP